MKPSTPEFAVVGHPNKGKSSIVATLAEDDRVAISAAPGTTRKARRHTFTIDGQPRYSLVDTPGFQRPGEVLAWLRAHTDKASDRPDAVAAFVASHAEDPRFADECELLKPLIEGAGILYVVDAAKPYGPEYELEMEILRWTGRPRMALINMIGEGDYQHQWRDALDQYFSLVRVFDAMHADFDKRVSLLRAFGEIDETWRDELDKAVVELQKERDRRVKRSAAEIARCLVDTLTCTERTTLKPWDNVDAKKQKLGIRLREKVRGREQHTFENVQRIYRHQDLAREAPVTDIVDTDLFTTDKWEVFGLSRGQLAVTGAFSGAAAGGGIDLILGGASLALGAGVGAVVGGAGAWFGSGGLARVKVLGGTLGGRVLQVGPIKARNFPWVLLGRAWLHHHLVAERNHARRTAIVMAVDADRNLMDVVPDALKKQLAASFRRIARGDTDGKHYERLVEQVEELLHQTPVTKSGQPGSPLSIARQSHT